MEFDSREAIAQIIASFGSRHGACRISVLLSKSSDRKDDSCQVDEASSSPFVARWCWCSSSTQLKPFELDDIKLIPNKYIPCDNQREKEHEDKEKEDRAKASDFAAIEVTKSLETTNDNTTIALYTPLISHRDQALLGVLLTEAEQDTGDEPTEEGNEDETNKKDQEGRLRRTAAVAAEVISAILSDSPRWGLVSQPREDVDVNVEEALRLFMELFEELRKKPLHDKWLEGGRGKFERQIEAFMRARMPIAMVLPSFPFKSSNTRHKVISRNADMAEKLALETLKHFCTKVREFYPPGAALVIVSDGRVYSSQFEIELKYVLAFQRQIREFNDCPDISFAGLGDFLPATPEANKRDALLTLFGQNMDKIDELLRNNADFNRVYCGFKKFMAEELSFPEGATVKQRRDRCAGAAKEMMKSNDAYGRLVECVFPNHVRLSIHAHSNIEKVGISMMRMSPGSDMQWGTPWHNCAVLRKSGEWELVRRNVAEQRGYELRHSEDTGLHYYVESDTPRLPVSVKDENTTAAKPPLKNRIFVGGIPSSVSETEVREFCTVAGAILEMDYCKARQKKRPAHAYVTFGGEAEAAWAVENLNGTALSGATVRVEFPL